MIFLVDMSQMIHSYFHVRTNDDRYDVTERTLERLERIRLHFQKLYPDCVFVSVFDGSRETFRHLLYDKYKANRTSDPDLPEIVASVFDAVDHDADWIAIKAPLMLEADDVMASIAAQYNGKVIIHSNDKDMLSCLENGRVLIIKKSLVDEQARELKFEFYNHQQFVAEFGFEPSKWMEFRMITGDSSDNLTALSWRWAGPELAKRVILNGCPLESVPTYDHELAVNKKQSATYLEFRSHLALHRKLVRLRDDMPWPFELMHLKELELMQ